LAVPIARTVGVGVVNSTHVSAPEAFWRTICDAYDESESS
jgi:hypothetical protein